MRTGTRRHRSPERIITRWLLPAFSGPLVQIANFYILIALLAVCALGGGSSFANVTSLLYVRPIAVIAVVAAVLIPAPANWRMFRAPIILFILFALLIALQLVPLPPAIWTTLPGRAPYIAVADLAGAQQPWRPVSLTPDLTMNALVSLVVPGAVLANFVKLKFDQRYAMILIVIALCGLSAILGVAQIAGGPNSAFYFYQRTYAGFPVGFLANRNHHAALLALVFPALRIWTMTRSQDRAWVATRRWLALGIGVLILPIILATGSRTGMALAALSILTTFVIFPKNSRNQSTVTKQPRLALVRLMIPALLVALVALTYIFGRAASIDRLLSLAHIDADFRFRFAPVMLDIIAKTFPVGTGFGSFDPLFRQYEPDAILKSTYFNHAHNELIELTIMAGLPGLLLLGGFVTWVVARMIASLRMGYRADTAQFMGRFGGMAIIVILLASLVDYPLRAPLMAFVFTLGCCWACENRTTGVGTPREQE